ncbi:hypothetical protein [Cellulomonas endophytica]|uniref:hypothetical protein n=1 Tax=Cellulomonas endophytica TaxID=2494735 RepID=UPI001012BF24|nr:hypothetical protein [Cellulomonas endophytica]
MDQRRPFEERTAALRAAVRAQPGVVALLLLGSAAEPSRRDEWSDHDFFVLAAPDAVERLRDVHRWLPDPEHLVGVAREGAVGFTALYDDGHVLEFAAATETELAGAPVGDDHRVVLDVDGTAARLVAAGAAQPAPAVDAANETTLALVKLLIGVGRARRGERVAAGLMVRAWALGHLLRAVRARLAPAGAHPEPLDPSRRLEAAVPDVAAEIDDALAWPVEEAALALFRLARARLEPDWPAFPTAVADAVALRLGWVRRP